MNADVAFLLFQARVISDDMVADSPQEELDEVRRPSCIKDSQENPRKVGKECLPKLH